MNLDVIKYWHWEFEVDKHATENAYEEIELSGAESCDCNYCKNFIATREIIYSQEIRELFNKLRVNSRKEADASEFTKLAHGLHYYLGVFHFKGNILKGPDSSIPLPSG